MMMSPYQAEPTTNNGGKSSIFSIINPKSKKFKKLTHKTSYFCELQRSDAMHKTPRKECFFK